MTTNVGPDWAGGRPRHGPGWARRSRPGRLPATYHRTHGLRLPANKTPRIRAWADRDKVEPYRTPAHVSWATPIEAQFGPLRTFVIGNSNHPDHAFMS